MEQKAVRDRVCTVRGRNGHWMVFQVAGEERCIVGDDAKFHEQIIN